MADDFAKTFAEAKARSMVMIPARLGSSRFPGKMLAKIRGRALVAHTLAAAREAAAQAGLSLPCCIAAEEEALVAAAREAMGENAAFLTSGDYACGTDRIWAALQQSGLDKQCDTIINWQGDLPFLPKGALDVALALHFRSGAEITSLAAPLTGDPSEANKVKAVLTVLVGEKLEAGGAGRALYFTRAPAPHGGPFWHHIGLYIFQKPALARFASLPVSYLEQLERLEQLRALEAGMTLNVALIAEAPLSIDAPDDLEKLTAYLEAQ